MNSGEKKIILQTTFLGRFQKVIWPGMYSQDDGRYFKVYFGRLRDSLVAKFSSTK